MSINIKKLEFKDNIVDYELGYLVGKLKAQKDFEKDCKTKISKGNNEYERGYYDGYKYTYNHLKDNQIKEDELAKLIKNNLINKYV